MIMQTTTCRLPDCSLKLRFFFQKCTVLAFLRLYLPLFMVKIALFGVAYDFEKKVKIGCLSKIKANKSVIAICT